MPMSGKEMSKLFLKKGYQLVSGGKGSHMKLKKSVLCKYLIQKGLEDLDKKFGQIKEILKKEKMIED